MGTKLKSDLLWTCSSLQKLECPYVQINSEFDRSVPD